MSKIGLIITTYNRPNYLKVCFESLLRADLSKIEKVCVIDDCSTDPEVIKLINWFTIRVPKNASTVLKTENKSIKDSLLTGFNTFFEEGFDTVINLDGDAIVRTDFVDRLLDLHNKYPLLIKTGFNCNTLNRDGSVRHEHLYHEHGAIFRQSVGGINMCMGREAYLRFVKPALLQTLSHGGNWDNLSCINSMAESLPIAVTVPSVVQHLGVVSSMGHGAGGEPADVADDFKPLGLANVTLIGVADDVQGLIHAAKISMTDIHFGSVKILSHSEPQYFPVGIEFVEIEGLGSKQAYSKFIFSQLADYVDTEFMIVFQADGFILNAKAFPQELFHYDYAGAVWNFYDDGMRVGNGGLSWRSKKLHVILKGDKSIVLCNDDKIKDKQEDHNLARIYRRYLENNYQIKFAPEDIAEQFSIEAWGCLPPNNKYNGSFGFHGFSVDFSNAGLPYVPYLLPNPQRKIFE